MRFSVGFFFLTLQPRFEVADARAELTSDFTNPSHSEEQDEDAEDDEEFGGTETKHGVLLRVAYSVLRADWLRNTQYGICFTFYAFETFTCVS